MQQGKFLEANLENPFNGNFCLSEFHTSENGGEWIGGPYETDEGVSVWRFEQQSSFELPSGNMVYGGSFSAPRNRCLPPQAAYFYYTAEQVLCIYHFDRVYDLYLVEHISETEFWLCEIENDLGWSSRLKFRKSEASRKIS